MTISTSCPGCKSKYNVADSMAGKKAKCKKCGAILAIPKPDDPVLAEASEPVLADLAGSSPLDGLTDRDLGGDPLGPSPLSPGRKPAGTAAAAAYARIRRWRRSQGRVDRRRCRRRRLFAVAGLDPGVRRLVRRIGTAGGG